METEQPQTSVKKQRSISFISIASGFIWFIASLPFIYWIQDSTIAGIFTDGYGILFQTGIGCLTGIFLGGAGLVLFNHPMFKKIADEYFIIQQVKELNLNKKEVLLVSVVAGISEEIFFRAAIQPLIGIWLTSVLFIAIHGYIRVHSFTHTLFALFTFILSMALGWLFIYYGLISAIIAHAVYDVILLYKITQSR